MILISHYRQTYLVSDDDDGDIFDEQTEQLMTDEPVSFRDLVSLMREHPYPSCHPARGETFEWLSAESTQDYRTGEWVEQTLHFSRANKPHAARYWRCAMKAAGIIR